MYSSIKVSARIPIHTLILKRCAWGFSCSMTHMCSSCELNNLWRGKVAPSLKIAVHENFGSAAFWGRNHCVNATCHPNNHPDAVIKLSKDWWDVNLRSSEPDESWSKCSVIAHSMLPGFRVTAKTDPLPIQSFNIGIGRLVFFIVAVKDPSSERFWYAHWNISWNAWRLIKHIF